MLDLTSREKEQPAAEGAPAPIQVQEELPAEEGQRGPAGDGEEQGAGESQEREDQHSMEERDEDADGPEEDTVSNKSLDLNLASRLMGFKLAEGEGGAASSGGPAQQDQKHACDVCGKSFKFLGTLSRHRKAHGREEPREEGTGASGGAEGPLPVPAVPPAPEPEEKPANPSSEEPPAEEVSPAAEKQGEEAEGASDGEGVAEKKPSEKSDDDKKPKTDSPRSVASKADKRKKVCSVCNKRFWSLQDLTRHMRSHTGKGGACPGDASRACAGSML